MITPAHGVNESRIPVRSRRRPSRAARPRPPRCVAEWVIRSLSGDQDGSSRVLLWLSEASVRTAAAQLLRQRGLEVREAADPSVAYLGQRFDVVVIDLAIERSLELGCTMRTARYADAILFVTRDPFVAEMVRPVASGDVAVVTDARDVATLALSRVPQP